MTCDGFVAHNYDFWLTIAVTTDPAGAGNGINSERAVSGGVDTANPVADWNDDVHVVNL